MIISEEIENAQKGIKSLIREPLCKILLQKSFFTQIQLETLLIEHLIGRSIDQKITQEQKAKARIISPGRSRGAYNRVLKQSRIKLEKTLYSMLLLGYLGVIADVRVTTFVEASEKLQKYLNILRSRQRRQETTHKSTEEGRRELNIENMLRKELLYLLTAEQM